MSERALTKTAPTHYVVFFPCDKSWFMTVKNKIMCSSLVTPIVGERYTVKWGSRGESDEGVIVGAGHWFEMRTMLMTKKGTVLEDDAVVSVPEPCTVIAVATPPGYYEIPEPTAVAPEPTAVAPEPTAVAPEPTAVAPEPTAVAPEPTAVAPEPTAVAPEPTAVVQEPTPIRHTPLPQPPTASQRTRPSTPTFRGNDAAIITYLQQISTGIQKIQATQRSFHKRLTDLDIQSQNCVQRLDQILHNNTTNITSSSDITISSDNNENNIADEDVPEEFVISDSRLRQLAGNAKNVGHFGSLLLVELFPELFGLSNLRYSVNWFGNGSRDKRELDPARKRVLTKYVKTFYPEARNHEVLKRVIERINERLRRPTHHKKADDEAQQPSQVGVTRSMDFPYASTSFTESLNDYINL